MHVKLLYTETVSKKPKPGRPLAKNPLCVVAHFRMTKAEAMKLEAQAKAAGLKLGEYLRRKILEG